jgi:hypothetical protein
MDIISELHREILIQINTTNPSPGVEYSLIMVESDAEVLVKEERRPKEIPAAGIPSNLPSAMACCLSV